MVPGVLQHIKRGIGTWFLLATNPQRNRYFNKFSHNSGVLTSYSLNCQLGVLPILPKVREGIHYSLVDNVDHATCVHVSPVGKCCFRVVYGEGGEEVLG